MSRHSLKSTSLVILLPVFIAFSTLALTDPVMLIGTETLPTLLPETASPAHQEEIRKIDTQLQALYSELKRYRKEEINTEMKAQPYMFDNWHEFVQEVKISEHDQQHIKELKTKINSLIERKKALLKN